MARVIDRKPVSYIRVSCVKIVKTKPTVSAFVLLINMRISVPNGTVDTAG